MDPMKELIDEQTVEHVMLALLVAGPLLGLAGGLVWSLARRGALRLALGRGLCYGLAGPLVWALWRLFSWLTRFQPGPTPEQDYYGLERVDILLLNVAIFVAVGVVLGLLWRRLGGPQPVAATAATGDSAPLNQPEMQATSSGELEAQQ